MGGGGVSAGVLYEGQGIVFYVLHNVLQTTSTLYSLFTY